MNDSTLSKNTKSHPYPWHKKSWSLISNAKANKQLPHAILLVGEEGIGKNQLAKRIAKSLICQTHHQSNEEACNQCQSCKTYDSGANPDFLRISLLEDKQQISVDQIRQLSEFLTYSRSYNTSRVVILSPAERMNLNAANSLLKSLEEPSANTIIILVSSQLHTLLPTIKSRCQIITVNKPSTEDAIHWLSTQQPNNFPEQELRYHLGINHGKPLNTLSISTELIDDRRNFIEDIQSIINGKQAVTETAKKWEKYDKAKLLDWQITLLQIGIKQQISISHMDKKVQKRGRVSFNSENESKLSNEAANLTQKLKLEALWLLYQKMIKEKQYIHTSVNPLIHVETMLMLWKKTVQISE